MKDNIIQALQNSTTKKVLVIGAVIIDEVIQIDTLPKSGEDIPGTLIKTNVGGCAWNVLLSLKRLNIPTVCGTIIGKGVNTDFVLDALSSEGFSPIFKNEEYDCGKCLAFVENTGERTFLTFAGVEECWTEKILSEIDKEEFDFVYLSGYEIACSTGHQIVKKIKELPKNIQIIIDLGPRILDIPNNVFDDLLRCNSILVMNEQEATMITKESMSLTQQGNHMSEKFKRPIMIHAGEQGSYYFDSGNMVYHIPVAETKVVDTVGAGDAHTGGFLAGLSLGIGIEDSLYLANEIGRYVIQKNGSDTSPTITELINQ